MNNLNELDNFKLTKTANISIFGNLKKSIELELILPSSRGSLYVNKGSNPKIMVRHFDGEIPSKLINTFVILVNMTREWISNHSKINKLVYIEEILEVGFDFLMLPFHIYYTSLSAFEDKDFHSEIPKEYSYLKNELKLEFGKSKKSRDLIIEDIVKRSLLEPSAKTFFDGEKFIVVEPRITLRHLKKWEEISNKNDE